MFRVFACCCLLLGAIRGGQSLPSQSALKSDNRDSLAENYAALVRDVKWFFHRFANFATTIEGMLPNITHLEQQSSHGLNNSTRVHFLKGLLSLLAGFKEISITIQQSFDTEDVYHLEQLKQAKIYVQHIVKLLKDWFAQMRLLLAELYRLYSYYAPEVLLGRCLGQYAQETYPEREIYEYPLLLFNDMFETAWDMLPDTERGPNVLETDIDNTATEAAVEQNEIPHKEEAITYAAQSTTNATAHENEAGLETTTSTTTLNATKPWHKCFQHYTADTIMRQLKMYFIEA